MAEDWAKTVAKRVDGRVADEAEKAATLRKRFDEGVARFRKQVLDLAEAVNANIETGTNRVQVIVVEDGISLAAGYRRIVTLEELGVVSGIPACVGKVTLQLENRKGATEPESREIFITSAGVQTTFYHYVGKDLKIMGEADFKRLVEYFAS